MKNSKADKYIQKSIVILNFSNLFFFCIVREESYRRPHLDVGGSL
jgi:hypothetical protein